MSSCGIVQALSKPPVFQTYFEEKKEHKQYINNLSGLLQAA